MFPNVLSPKIQQKRWRVGERKKNDRLKYRENIGIFPLPSLTQKSYGVGASLSKQSVTTKHTVTKQKKQKEDTLATAVSFLLQGSI